MKTIKFILIGMVLLISGAVKAQVSVSVNLGAPPLWGPVGYSGVNYYYLPDVEAYYDVPSSMFIYNEGGAWVHRAYLPSRYRNYDLYNGYKVVMTDYHGNAPYTQFNEHKMKYKHGYRGPEQRSIGERPGRGNHGEKQMHENNNHRDNGHGNNERRMEQNHGNNERRMEQNHGNNNMRMEQNHGNGNNKGNPNGKGNEGHGKDGGKGNKK